MKRTEVFENIKKACGVAELNESVIVEDGCVSYVEDGFWIVKYNETEVLRAINDPGRTSFDSDYHFYQIRENEYAIVVEYSSIFVDAGIIKAYYLNTSNKECHLIAEYEYDDDDEF